MLPPFSHVQRNVPLAGLTTLAVGGPALYFSSCTSVEEMRKTLRFAMDERMPLQVIGGGSNIIFPDEGFDGLVLRVDVRGTTFQDNGDHVSITVAAGERWDDVVRLAIERGLSGIECLSGIPGNTGATPVQNVGAYGQEVSETIVSLRALERRTLEIVEFTPAECGFGYRQSRFKNVDADRYVILEVTFDLPKERRPVIRYPELKKFIDESAHPDSMQSTGDALLAVRNAVLALRKKKSMVIDPADPNTRSVGSFFLNPVISPERFAALERSWRDAGQAAAIPSYPTPQGVKIPAAWLVEHAGFKRGLRRGGAGIYSNHALALINCGGTATEILRLAEEIRSGVRERFGISIELEPVVVRPPVPS